MSGQCPRLPVQHSLIQIPEQLNQIGLSREREREREARERERERERGVGGKG